MCVPALSFSEMGQGSDLMGRWGRQCGVNGRPDRRKLPCGDWGAEIFADVATGHHTFALEN